MGGKAAVGGRSVDIIINRTGLYSKATGATCWTRTANVEGGLRSRRPVIPLQGVRFAAPVKAKNGATFSLKATDLLGQYGGGTFEYTIDAKTLEVTAVAKGATKATVKALAKAPAIGKRTRSAEARPIRMSDVWGSLRGAPARSRQAAVHDRVTAAEPPSPRAPEIVAISRGKPVPGN